MNLVVAHNAGFFSCCSVKLDNIVHFINNFKRLPEEVDGSQQFDWYKKDNTLDVTYDYFEHYSNTIMKGDIVLPINYTHFHQFSDYRRLEYNSICSLVQKYFTPSTQITNIIQKMESKYSVNYDNTCVLFYRGNDKITETALCDYSEYAMFAEQILEQHPTITFLLQSDETEFLQYFTNMFPNNSFYFKDEIRHMNKTNDTVDKVFSEQNEVYSKFYLAITIIMSKCQYIICGTGNCSIWIMFYRGHANNVYQNINGQWLLS